MGEKSERRILEGLEALKRRSTRRLLGNVRPVALRWLEWLRAQPGVTQAEPPAACAAGGPPSATWTWSAGCSTPEPVMKAFTAHPDVQRVLAQGENKSSVELKDGLNMQLWIQPPERFGTLLQFVTGSKDHNVRLREMAQKKGLSLSEQWLRDADGNEKLYANEEDLYAALGLPWIPPELREDRGEIQAALAATCRAWWRPARSSPTCTATPPGRTARPRIQEMAEAAIARGLKVLAITDHSGGLGVASGLIGRAPPPAARGDRAVQARLGDRILLLQGSEVEIHADGSLDYPDEVLAELDIVVASLHSSLRQPRQQITERLVRAIRTPHVDIIGHPSGRLLPNREGADLDWDAVLRRGQRSRRGAGNRRPPLAPRPGRGLCQAGRQRGHPAVDRHRRPRRWTNWP